MALNIQGGGPKPGGVPSGGISLGRPAAPPPQQAPPPAPPAQQQQYQPAPPPQQAPQQLQFQQAPQQQYQQAPPPQQAQPLIQQPAARPAAGAGVIHLKKGQKFGLMDNNPNLSQIRAGLGWDVARQPGQEFDLDVSLFMVDNNGATLPDRFIFYNNPSSTEGSVQYLGDNRSGAGEGDDEAVRIDLNRVPGDVGKISFTVTIYEAEQRGQNFGQVSNAYIRIVDEQTNQELIRYQLDNTFSVETGVVVGELYRHQNAWKFNAIGSGFQGGLAALCRNYGLDVTD